MGMMEKSDPWQENASLRAELIQLRELNTNLTDLLQAYESLLKTTTQATERLAKIVSGLGLEP